ncbi:Uncharacterised protein [Candidatus Venteria ishoeyi]|uniref:Uncharacterized protein n=1 Tax=Candidatus Venteria ishoeyi TaxID=1899563 RepID=A0A1H6F8R0_9GAMM|nr:Uncharacterised protein [Candidatus Venteria ishoeyi]
MYAANAGIRPKITPFITFCTAMKTQPGKITRRQINKWIAFIIPQQNIIRRLMTLNQVVFQQQRFGFGVGDGDINTGDARYQGAGFWRLSGGTAKITGEAVFQVFGFTDIKNLVGGIPHLIHAGFLTDGTQKGFGIKRKGAACLHEIYYKLNSI